jgi:AraC-like DNA-binding protein
MAWGVHQPQFFVSCGRISSFRRPNCTPPPFVHVAAHLLPESLARLRAVLTDDDELTVVADWPALASALHSQPIDAIVIDPQLGHDDAPLDEREPSLLLTLLTEFRSVPVILYSTLSREGVRAVVPLARSGAYQVIFRGVDDSRKRLREQLDQIVANVFAERLLRVLVPRLEAAEAPAEVVQAVTRLFRAPQAFRTVHQLATVAGRRRGMLDRWMSRAGLAPAKMLILAARVAWTYHYLRAPGNRLKTLALRLGYADTVPLGRHVRRMTGLTVTQLRRGGVSADVLFEILVRRLVR